MALILVTRRAKPPTPSVTVLEGILYSIHAFKRSAIKRRIAIKRSVELETEALRLKACILYPQ